MLKEEEEEDEEEDEVEGPDGDTDVDDAAEIGLFVELFRIGMGGSFSYTEIVVSRSIAVLALIGGSCEDEDDAAVGDSVPPALFVGYRS